MLRTTKMKFDVRKYQDSRFATRHDSGADHDFMSSSFSANPLSSLVTSVTPTSTCPLRYTRNSRVPRPFRRTNAAPCHASSACRRRTGSALASLEPRLLLVDHIGRATTPHHLGARLVLQRTQRVPHLHDDLLLEMVFISYRAGCRGR